MKTWHGIKLSELSTRDLEGGVTKRFVVKKGSFGKKFKMLEGFGNAHNRAINKAHAKKMLRTWDGNLSGICTLIERKDGDGYEIADGQHRFLVASTIGNQTLRCEVYPEDELPFEDIALWISLLNRLNQRWTAGDHMCSYQNYSEWPAIFGAMGCEFPYRPRRGQLIWPTLIHAYSVANTILARKQIIEGARFSLPQYLDAWTETSAEEVRKMVEWWDWWAPALEEARSVKFTTAASHRMTTLSIAIWNENKSFGRARLDKARDRLFAGNLRLLRAEERDSMVSCAREMLRAMNRSVRTRVVTLLTYDGR